MTQKGYGFHRDIANDRLMIFHSGTEVFRITAASGVTMYGGALTIDSGGLTVPTAFDIPAASLNFASIKNLTEAHFDVSANVNVIGTPALLFRITTAGTAAGETINVTVTKAMRVIDVWAIPRTTGAGADALTVGNGATVITNSLTLATALTTVRATTLDNAQWELAAAGTLRVVQADGDNNPVTDVYVLGVQIA